MADLVMSAIFLKGTIPSVEEYFQQLFIETAVQCML